jgi:8-oxo-dGTP pyrophosphatase MutT (NUDIX family)
MKNKCKKAGVLILFYPKQNELILILTRRTKLVQYHPNQISFPGGQCEPNEDPLGAGLRETQEELGIPPDKIKIIGQLTPFYIPPSNYCIYPAVGILDKLPTYKPREKEVAEVIEVPLVHMLDSRNTIREIWKLNNRKVKVPFYLYKNHKIWGATAMVLAELLDVIRSLDINS